MQAAGIIMPGSLHREEGGIDRRTATMSVDLAASHQEVVLVSCRRIEAWAKRSHQINTDWMQTSTIIISVITITITGARPTTPTTIMTQLILPITSERSRRIGTT